MIRDRPAIEGNVDKLAPDCLKERGLSWRPEGAHCMCQIIELRENGELSAFISKRWNAAEKAALAATISL